MIFKNILITFMEYISYTNESQIMQTDKVLETYGFVQLMSCTLLPSTIQFLQFDIQITIYKKLMMTMSPLFFVQLSQAQKLTIIPGLPHIKAKKNSL